MSDGERWQVLSFSCMTIMALGFIILSVKLAENLKAQRTRADSLAVELAVSDSLLTECQNAFHSIQVQQWCDQCRGQLDETMKLWRILKAEYVKHCPCPPETVTIDLRWPATDTTGGDHADTK